MSRSFTNRHLRNFPVTSVSAAIGTLNPGGLSVNTYVSGKGRMTVFEAAGRWRTFDFQEGDVGYILQSNPHYIEDTGDADLVLIKMFKAAHYEDISLAEWMAHTPHLLVDQHLQVGNKCSTKFRKRNR